MDAFKDFHLTWIHWVGIFGVPFLLSLLHEGFRSRLSEIVIGRLVKAGRALLGLDKDPEKPKEEAVPLTPLTTFEEHIRGDEKMLSVIKQALDQNANVVQNGVRDMSEKSNLIALSQKEMRQEVDSKLGTLHEKVNTHVSKVDTLTGKLEVLIPLVQEQLRNGKNGDGPAKAAS